MLWCPHGLFRSYSPLLFSDVEGRHLFWQEMRKKWKKYVSFPSFSFILFLLPRVSYFLFLCKWKGCSYFNPHIPHTYTESSQSIFPSFVTGFSDGSDFVEYDYDSSAGFKQATAPERLSRWNPSKSTTLEGVARQRLFGGGNWIKTHKGLVAV